MSFYPPGWDYDRVLNASSMDDFSSITDEQRTTMLEGLKEAGLFEGVEAWQRIQAEHNAAREATMAEKQLRDRELMAPYLRTLDRVFLFSDGWSEWGFVIYRACCYDPAEEARWAQFRACFDMILDKQVAKYHNYHPKLDRAIELRQNIWIEDPDLNNASPEDISRHFAQLSPTLSCGYCSAVCLMITSESVDSVLNSPLSSSAASEQREALPFVVAVNAKAHEMPFSPPPQGDDEDSPDEGEDYPSFRVAVESLMGILYKVTDLCELLEMTSNIRHEKDIWLDRPNVVDDGVRHYENRS